MLKNRNVLKNPARPFKQVDLGVKPLGNARAHGLCISWPCYFSCNAYKSGTIQIGGRGWPCSRAIYCKAIDD